MELTALWIAAEVAKGKIAAPQTEHATAGEIITVTNVKTVLQVADRNVPTERDKLKHGATIGGAIGALLVVAAAVIFAVTILKRRNKLCCKKPRDEQLSEETPEPVVYATVQNRRHTHDPALQRESSHYGGQAQTPHTSFTEHHAETGNNLYEDILKATDDSNIVQENVEQEAGHRVNIRTQHVELVMTDETTEDDGLEMRMTKKHEQ
ncbi:uncharacterized protein LOC128204685 [Mya arenaria]|uniref:uncharacterized protein LOC128204685 n=1 Tax=Mya arenaria TaxID=6604 RepID=UPI0022E26442|nr:uncharacterized protein LOC128204685 [Mya arenaria]